MDTFKPLSGTIIAAMLALAATGAQAQIYKWVDDKGVVNYSADPPSGRPSHAVDPNTARVTVVPSPPRSTTTVGGSESGLRERVSRLEQELESERAQHTAGPSDDERLARAREQCLAERRVDCETNPYGALPVANDPIVIVRPIVRPLRPIRPMVPTPPPQQKPREVLEPARSAGKRPRDE